MFDELASKLAATLQRLTGRGVLSEDAVREGLREIRRILLEADVSFELTREFLERVEAKAVGQQVIKSVRPGQQLVKIVYDELVAMLGEKPAPIAHATVPPTVILLVGLQGSGKTTTAGKLAKRLKLEQKAPFLIAADVYRPAAAEQLATLAKQIDVGCYDEISSQSGRQGGGADSPPDRPTARPSNDVVALVKRGLDAAGKARARTVLVDTAGRLQIDEDMMAELRRVKAAVSPHEILLVADGMTGQDAVRIARGFHDALGITGVVLTKMDGDARGGAALSIYGVTKAPIKYVGTGERLDALEPFHPDRMAGRILQQGDVLSLVEKAQEAVDETEAKRLAKKAVSKKGLDLQDFLGAMRQMQKLGPLKNVLGMLPGVNPAILKTARVDDKRLKHVEAIVLSMTPAERADPDVMNGSRRMRIAKGSGRTVQEVNQLLSQFKQMQKMMKVAGKPGGRLPFGGPFPG
jgi:signal recognition particle subunit SRP54